MEFWNFFTHTIGAFLALYLLYKIIHVRLREFIFAVCMVVCLGFSSAYHLGLYLGKDDLFIRKLDHCGIFLLIAGTSTALFSSKRATALLWASTIGFVMGIIDNAVLSTRMLTTGYLFFGWICTMWAIMEYLYKPPEGHFPYKINPDIYLIAIGSSILTVGSLINLYDYQFGHVIFHILTLLGSVFYVKLVFRESPKFIGE